MNPNNDISMQIDPDVFEVVAPNVLSMKPQQWMPVVWDDLCQMCCVHPDMVTEMTITPSTIRLTLGDGVHVEAPTTIPEESAPQYGIELKGTQLKEKLEVVPGAGYVVDFRDRAMWGTLSGLNCVVTCEELCNDPLFVALRVRLQERWPEVFGEPETVEEGFLEQYDSEFAIM